MIPKSSEYNYDDDDNDDDDGDNDDDDDDDDDDVDDVPEFQNNTRRLDRIFRY